MKAKEFNKKRTNLLKESSYMYNQGARDPFSIRAQVIHNFLEWYEHNGSHDWDGGLLPELLATHLESIGAKGNESPQMTKLMKIAVKQIVEQYREIHDEGYLEDCVDEINDGCERLIRLGVFPDLLTAMQKSIAATIKDDLEKWVRDNPNEEY